jgi:integrase/recombinase XerC
MFSTDASRTAAPTQNRTSAAYDASELKIIQQQVGHEHASTTSIYTCVSSDFRTRTLRRHLDATIAAALRSQDGRQV